jgi:fructose-specific PTS system IIA-like component
MTGKTGAALEFAFVCSLSSGLHARPASHLAEAANAFASDCFLTNLRNGLTANGKSVLAIIAADVRQGDRCTVQLRGTDEQSAYASLQRFVEQVLPGVDVPLAGISTARRSGTLPRVLQAAAIECCFGLPVSRGIAHGKVVPLNGMVLPSNLNARASDPDEELRRVNHGLAAVRERIRQKLTEPISTTEQAVLLADLAIANDISLAEKLAERIRQGRCAGQAVVEAGEFFTALLRHSESELIRERALDIEEICLQLLDEIYGTDLQAAAIQLLGPSVLVAETLAPQQLLALDRRWLKALVLEYSGATSHAVILARSLAIPTLAGVKNARLMLPPGTEVLVDANRGFAVPQFPAPVQRFYEREVATLARKEEVLARQASEPAISADGRVVEVAANASSLEESVEAFRKGADGIGLFRTETIFLEKNQPPSEDEQYAVYAEVMRAAAGRAVIFRTLDIGGDKAVPYLNLSRENNPFLGYRGVRIYADHKELLRAHLRAVLRASALGPAQIMAPMISSLEEVLQFKDLVSQARATLASEGITLGPYISIGVMIEVPSAALILDQLCAEVDFFSIGTNDLCQYFFAAERGNPKVAALSSVRHPAFIRFLQQIVRQIRQSGKWVGMCGEMAAESRHLPLLIGLGLDEVSLPAAEIPEIKRKIGQVSSADCEQLLEKALSFGHTREVDHLLEQGVALRSTLPLLSEELVLLHSVSRNKEEAIQEIVDAFYVTGRTDDRPRLEEALWAREGVYSTGLGFGFATPHCKSAAVEFNSIGILKLRQPVDWGSVDSEPVGMVILIAMRDSEVAGAHLQVFSKLARKLMNEEFRKYLLGVESAEEMVEYLTQQLDMAVQ